MSQEQPAELRIGKKAFLQSALILLCLMVLAGLLSRFIPSGSFETMLVDGRDVIVPGSFQYTEIPVYPVWRWFTAPLEVLWGPDALVISVIILFILLVGGSFAVLNRVGVLKALIAPLADLVGVTRQAAVLAFAFGDGFSNVLYPTNPVLLIVLGLTVVSYPKWFKWVIGLQLVILGLTTAFLLLAVACNYGPF